MTSKKTFAEYGEAQREAERGLLAGAAKVRIDQQAKPVPLAVAEFAVQQLAALKAQPSGVVLPEPMKRGDEVGSGEYGAAMIRGYNARLNSSPASAGDDESRHDAVKALHDVMQAVPCASLYSLAEAVLDAGYVKHVIAGGVDERAAIQSDISCDSAYRNGLIAGFNFGINDDEAGYQRSLACYQGDIHEARDALTASSPNHSEQVPEGFRAEILSMARAVTEDRTGRLIIDKKTARRWLSALSEPAGSVVACPVCDGRLPQLRHGRLTCNQCGGSGPEPLIKPSAAPSAGSQGGDV